MNKWITQIEEIKQHSAALFGALSPESLNYSPSPKEWSIALNLEHLIKVNRSYYPTFDQLLAGSYKPVSLARIGFLASFFGKFILDSVKPDRKRKMKTFPIWEPIQKDANGFSDVLERFLAHQDELALYIKRCEPLISPRCVISSPANKNIVYRLDQAFDIIISHQWRHLEQAKEVLSKAKK